MEPVHEIVEWGPERAADATELVAAALPAEELSEDELLAVCWEDPSPDEPGRGVVLATTDGSGLVVVVWRPPSSPGVGHLRLVSPDNASDRGGAAGGEAFVKLVVVHPGGRRAGRGAALLRAAEEWAWAQGAEVLRLAGSPPFYLWPGVDASATAVLCLLEARGYEPDGVGHNMVLSTAYRPEVPDGVSIRRVITDVDVAWLLAMVDEHWPEWRAETVRAVEHGCCHGAFANLDAVGFADGEPIGFACHSVSRAGWLGPMGTVPSARSTGVGQALVGRVCRDLMIAEMSTTEICWAGPVRFYAKSGATISRVFRQFRLSRPSA